MNYNYYLLNSLFQNRNRYYGAYPLRLYYNERLLKSTLFAILGFIAFIYILRWGFHVETYAAIAPSTIKDSTKIITFIDPAIIIPDDPAKSEPAKPKKGTPNTKPVIGPNKEANVEPLDPKSKGALNGDAKGKSIIGSDIPNMGTLVYNPPKKPNLIYTTVDKQAAYHDLYPYLGRVISYPPSAELYGTVMLSFVVEIDGSLSNLRIEQSLEKVLDEEALEAFEKISKPGMWAPALVKGEKVRFKYMMPINFKDGK